MKGAALLPERQCSARALDLLHRLLELLLHTLGGEPSEVECALDDRAPRLRVDVKAESCREANGAQGAKSVLAHSLVRIAHRADQPSPDVPLPLEGIVKATRLWVIRDRVQREVPPRKVLVDRGSERHHR